MKACLQLTSMRQHSSGLSVINPSPGRLETILPAGQVAKQVLDVIQYCTAKQHILWDMHEDDAVVEHGPGLEPPKLLLMDVFMPPDPILGKG